MVSGDASRASALSEARNKNPARYWDATSAAAVAATPLPTARGQVALGAGRQAAALVLRLIPDLLNMTMMVIDAELHDDIDHLIEQVLDVGARQVLSAARLLHHEDQLLERERRAPGVKARDRA